LINGTVGFGASEPIFLCFRFNACETKAQIISFKRYAHHHFTIRNKFIVSQHVFTAHRGEISSPLRTTGLRGPRRRNVRIFITHTHISFSSSFGRHKSLRIFAAITKSLHLSRSCTISLQFCAPRSSESFSTTYIRLFRGRPLYYASLHVLATVSVDCLRTH